MANNLTTAKSPRALAVLDRPLAPIKSALGFANRLDQFSFGHEGWSHHADMVPRATARRKELLPNLAEAQEANRILFPAAYTWVGPNLAVKPHEAVAMVNAMYKGLGVKPDGDTLEGMLSMFGAEASGIGDLIGMWKTVDITSTVLAIACRAIIAKHKFNLIKPADLREACSDASRRLRNLAGRTESFLDEFREVDAILLEFAHDEWEQPWLLPQYRPLLPRVLRGHSAHADEGAFADLIDREQAKLALEKPPEQPEQPKRIAAARKPSPTKRSRAAREPKGGAE
jgi:hypothetical protein